MKQVIYKYPIDPRQLDSNDMLSLSIPEGSTVLSVASQYEGIVLYALVNPDEKQKERLDVYVHGTGNPTYFPKSAKFIGTVKIMNGKLMFHVFVNK